MDKNEMRARLEEMTKSRFLRKKNKDVISEVIKYLDLPEYDKALDAAQSEYYRLTHGESYDATGMMLPLKMFIAGVEWGKKR